MPRLALMTRMRRGSWVKGGKTVRWLHSLVNIRIATTGKQDPQGRGGKTEVARVGLVDAGGARIGASISPMVDSGTSASSQREPRVLVALATPREAGSTDDAPTS